MSTHKDLSVGGALQTFSVFLWSPTHMHTHTQVIIQVLRVLPQSSILTFTYWSFDLPEGKIYKVIVYLVSIVSLVSFHGCLLSQRRLSPPCWGMPACGPPAGGSVLPTALVSSPVPDAEEVPVTGPSQSDGNHGNKEVEVRKHAMMKYVRGCSF